MTFKINLIEKFLKLYPANKVPQLFLILLLIYLIWKAFRFFLTFYRNQKFRRLETQLAIKRQEAINAIAPSCNRNDYLTANDDYKRGSQKERFYRKKYSLRLLEAFGNSCAKCGDKENGIDIDHFIFSKNEGGCFIMRHKDGHLINNAIPLCWTCNRAKSDNSYHSFFSDGELLQIFARNQQMTRRLNEKSIFDGEGELIKPKKVS